jgi:hypothetical protein
MNYVDPPDVPEGMTLREYRRAHRARSATARRRVLRLPWLWRTPAVVAAGERRGT